MSEEKKTIAGFVFPEEQKRSAQELLRMAAGNIDSRAVERDIDSERSMARTVAIFNAYSGKELTELEGWMFMLCLKMARSKAGKLNLDDYVDMCGYGSLAGECALKD